MAEQVVISVYYSRIPKTELYGVEISADLLRLEGEEQQSKCLRKYTNVRTSFNTIVQEMHAMLQSHPDAEVTMILGMTRKPQYKRRPRGFLLGDNMRNMIRDDLEQAKKMFAPIERKVKE